MRIAALFAVAGLLVGTAVADWGHPILWDQMGAIDTYGGHSTIDNDLGIYSHTADDFLCDATGYINDVHFAGWSYYGNQYIVGFRIKLWTDVPATPEDESHPGELLYQYDELTPYDGFFGWQDLGDGTFRINLPEDQWFFQEAGNIYWISIQGIMLDDGASDTFYWNFVDRNAETWGDDAAFECEYFGYAPWANWGWPTLSDGPDLYDGAFPSGWIHSADMAFVLSGLVPEPASLLLIGLGAMALRRR
ncbi:MAG: PEP-CTERM sorting domain-containing protein [Phycisphaerae bacterium]